MNAKVLGLLLAVAVLGLLATGSATALQSENPQYEKCWPGVCSVTEQPLESATEFGVAELSANPQDEKCWPDYDGDCV